MTSSPTVAARAAVASGPSQTAATDRAAVARINHIISSHTTKETLPLDDLEFLVQHARLLQDPSIAGNLVAFSQLLWDIIEDFTKAATMTSRRSSPAAAAAAVLARFYGAVERKIAPTKADLDGAIAFSKKINAITTVSPVQRDALLLSSLQLVGSIASVDPPAVLRHLKDDCWRLCGSVRYAVIFVLVAAMAIALRELLLMESVSNRAELAAEYLVAFGKDARFQTEVFQNATSTAPAKPRPAPATLNALAQLTSTLRVVVQRIVDDAPSAVQAALVKRLRSAVAAARTGGHFTSLHLPLVSAVGDWEFLVKLLLARLSSPPPLTASVTLPLVSPMEAVTRGTLHSVEGAATLLVAVEVAAKQPTDIVATQEDADATRLAELFFEEVLQAGESPFPYRSRRFIAASDLLRHLTHLVAHIALSHEGASRFIRERIVTAATRFSEMAKQLLTGGKQELYDVAWHSYTFQRAIMPVIQSICIRRDKPTANPDPNGEVRDHRTAFAAGAHELFDAIALMQPLALLHRSKAPKTDASKKIAALDWQTAQRTGQELMQFIASDPNQVRTLLLNLRRVTERPELGTDIFLSESVFFVTYVLSASKAATVTSSENMMNLWVPSSVRCCVCESQPLRSAGHFMLAGAMMRQHAVSIPIFTVYMNVFVAVPRSARDADRGYGPVPSDSVKLFSRMFARVVLAVESLEATPASKDVDGQGIAMWGIQKLAGVCAFYLALLNPNNDEKERRRQYFCSLIDTLQCTNPEVLGASRTAIEKLLLSLRHPAEAAVFLDYASAIVEQCRQSVTKRSTVEWLLDVKALLDARNSGMRSKL